LGGALVISLTIPVDGDIIATLTISITLTITSVGIRRVSTG
jgi:hypothetical protein